MIVEFAHLGVLLGLVLAIVPWVRTGGGMNTFSSLTLIPPDRFSTTLSVAERTLASLAITALVIALAHPYRPTEASERVGQGAQIVVLLDRSRSMDQPFYTQRGNNVSALAQPRGVSKGEMARRLLSEFAAQRKADMFGMIIFSTNPIPVMPLTQKPALIQAAIEAGNTGRGLAETNVGGALERALRFFEGRPYTGSRVVMLISDGAANLKWETRERIEHLAKRHRIALYWLYMRTRNTPGIFDALPANQTDEMLPHRSLHRFFSEMRVPYRAYTAEDPQSLEQVIADVGQLQNLPIHYREIKPKKSLGHWFYLAATLCLVPLLGLRILEATSWTSARVKNN